MLLPFIGTKKYNPSFYLWLIILSALCLRLLFAPLPGDLFDNSCHQEWGRNIVNYGITSVYDAPVSENVIKPNYPPGLLYILSIPSFLYKRVSPNFTLNTPSLLFLLKFPAILVDIFIGIAIFFLLKKITNPKIASSGLLLWLLNPGIIYNSSYWGQLDSIPAFFILLSIIFLVYKKTSFSCIFIALAIFMKVQSVIFVPIILFTIWKKHSLKRFILGALSALATAGIILFPSIYSNKLNNIINVGLHSMGYYKNLSRNAFNLWWLGFRQGAFFTQDTSFIFNLISYRNLSLILFSLACIFTLYFLYRKKGNPNSIYLAASFMSFSFFILPTEIHERYLFPIFPFLILLYHTSKKIKITYWILTCAYFLNLLYVLPFSVYDYNLFKNHPSATTIISLINVLTFGYFIYILLEKLKPKNNENRYHTSLLQ